MTPRTTRSLLALSSALLLVWLAACSDDSSAAAAGASGANGSSGTGGSSGGGASGTAGDAGTAGGAGSSAAGGTAGSGGDGGASGTDGASGSPNCGADPAVHVTGVFTDYINKSTVIAGAKLTVDGCPGLEAITDDEGKFSAVLTKGVAYNPRLEAMDYITSRTGEQVLEADFDASAGLLGTSYASIFQHYSASTPTLLAVAQLSVDPGPNPDPNDPCLKIDGVVFTVTGHPEAVVTYYKGPFPQPDATLTSTGDLGLAEISGLAANVGGTPVEVTASKPSCSISFASYPQTGRYLLENGVLTFANALMPPRTAPLSSRQSPLVRRMSSREHSFGFTASFLLCA